ncbi:MAG TPA: FAD-dependent oxidoreductase, partial [Gemmatimonadaceae bacterium]
DVIVATHVPVAGLRSFLGASLLQSKLSSYSTYIFGARLDAGTLAAGLYGDTATPYYYLRVHDDADGQYAIFGGADHRTGQVADTLACFDQVVKALCRLLPSARLERRWSGLIIETDDGLPFIGKVTDHQYVATGYAGNGLTFGTLGGLILHDAITATPNPWRDLLDPHRKPTSLDAIKTLAAENVDYAYYWIADRLRPGDRSGIENVARGEGKVLKIDGRRVAVHRKSDGEVVKVSAVCTHLGCLVRWNAAERTWDCPCHGSRFSPEGQILGGPAERPLERVG